MAFCPAPVPPFYFLRTKKADIARAVPALYKFSCVGEIDCNQAIQ